MKTTNNLWNLVQVSNLTIKTPEQRHSQRSGVSIVDFDCECWLGKGVNGYLNAKH